MSAPLHPETPLVERWSLTRRLGFRFFFVYFLLFVFPFPFGWIPETEAWAQWLYEPLNQLAVWFGRDVLGLAVSAIDMQNGSGDTTLSYVVVLVSALLAVIAAAVWSVLARRRPAHPAAHAWLRGLVRYFLVLMLITYGVVKVIKTQFPDPPDHKLLQPAGDMSPMGLLWLFMGASDAYTIFAGLMELAPAALLLFRRTTTAGALLLVAVMSNVVMLNLCYDVPVKINSLHYLAFALWLLLPQAAALVRFFTGGESRLRGEVDVLPASWRGTTPLRLLLIALVVAFAAHQTVDTLDRYFERGDGAPPLAYAGVYVVESHAIDGRAATEPQRWKDLRLRRGRATIVTASGERRMFELVHDPATRTISLTPDDGKGGPYRFLFAQDGALVQVRGVMDGSIHVLAARRGDTSQMLLRTRGFHWVNEVPLNR